MDALAEAFERLGGDHEVRVLEPSPPAVNEPPWFADDPVAVDHAVSDAVSPIGNTSRTWNDLCTTDPELARWCSERWLGAWRRLAPLPPTFAESRIGAHALAEHVIAPARHAANSKIGLRYTRGGFGTPFYGADVQVRMTGAQLVITRNGQEVTTPLTTLGAAADLAGIVAGAPTDIYTPTTELDVEAPLNVTEEAGRALGDWFGFAASVQEELRWNHREHEPSRLQIWPEHFDMAVELGAEAAGSRAAFGASPGDDEHPEPYLYVAPWNAPEPDPSLWNDEHFKGASLTYAELLGTDDQRALALDFYGSRFSALTKGGK